MHAGVHGRLGGKHEAGRTGHGTDGGRLLCMESLVQEAHSPMDQYGVLETERGSGSGYTQVQGAVLCRQQGRVRQVRSHLQVGADQSCHDGGMGQEGTEGSGASGAPQGDHQVQERMVPEAEVTLWAVNSFEEEEEVQVGAEPSTVERCIVRQGKRRRLNMRAVEGALVRVVESPERESLILGPHGHIASNYIKKRRLYIDDILDCEGGK